MKNYGEKYRFVFQHLESGMQPAAASEKTPAPAPEKVKPPESKEAVKQTSLAQDVEKTLQAEATKVLGGPLDYDDLAANPDKLDDTIGKLAERMGEMWDKLCALLAPLGLKPSEIDAWTKEPGGAHEDTKEKQPADWERQGQGISWNNLKCAEHAAIKLFENPTWLDYIKASSAKYGIRAPVFAAILEMESSFNPNARPKNKDGSLGKALGLAQAMPQAITDYKRSHPDANLMDPETAIDFIGFHLTQKINEANDFIKSHGMPASFELTVLSEPKWLYMAYNNGGMGYAVLRQYLKNPTKKENYEMLTPFQKAQRNGVPDWKSRADYASRVDEVANIYEIITAEPEKDVTIDSPPIAGQINISSNYGIRNHPIKGERHFHNGVDFPAPQGTPVLSIRDGVIAKTVENDAVSGNYITVQHPDGAVSKYLHLSSMQVSVGQQVKAGEQIGAVGTTGRSTGPHLHFIYENKGIPLSAANAVLAASERTTNTA